jgi:hypothetical protein
VNISEGQEAAVCKDRKVNSRAGLNLFTVKVASMRAWKMGGEGAPARGDSDPSHHGSQREGDAFAEPYLLLSDLDGLNMILLDHISKASSAWEKNGISLLGCEAEPQDLNPEGLSGSGTEDIEGAGDPEKGRTPFLTEGLFEFS